MQSAPLAFLRLLVLALAIPLAACGGGSEFEPVGPGPTQGEIPPDWPKQTLEAFPGDA